MKAKTSHKTAGIVLRSLDYGESDRIVTFYTNDFGKIKGIAKGARRSQRRFANTLEPFSCSTVLFSKWNRDSLALIENCDIISHYSFIRQDLEKTLLASYMIDLTDQFTLEGKRNTELFQLLQEFLTIIDGGKSSEVLIRFFEMRLLKYSGYEPVLDRCISCQKPVGSMDSCQFSSRAGGIKCKSCYPGTFDSLPVSLGTIKTLIMGRDMELVKINRLLLTEESAEESRRLFANFIQHILGKELKSVHVLNEIRRLDL